MSYLLQLGDLLPCARWGLRDSGRPEWNVTASVVGYVGRINALLKHLDKHVVQRVGGEVMLEYWIPASRLEES